MNLYKHTCQHGGGGGAQQYNQSFDLTPRPWWKIGQYIHVHVAWIHFGFLIYEHKPVLVF